MKAAGTPLQKRENHRLISGAERVLRGCFTLALLIGLGVTSFADDSSEKAKGKTDVVAADQEATALAFAGEHHPRAQDPGRIAEDSQSRRIQEGDSRSSPNSDRLSKLNSDKSKGRYEHELALWKLDSRIRLTAARSAMKDTDELRAELKSLIEQRHALNLQWLKTDKERTAARLAKLEADVKSAEEKLPQAVEAEVDRLLKSVKTNKPKVTAALKDAKKKNDTKKDGPAPAPKPAEPPPQP